MRCPQMFIHVNARSIGVVSPMLGRPLLRPDGFRVRGVTWVLILIAVLSTSPTRSSNACQSSLSSSSPPVSMGLSQRATDLIPSTHCKIPTSTSRNFRFLDLQTSGPPEFILARLELRGRGFALDIDSRCASAENDFLPGRAANKRGSDGNKSGSIYLESRSSPSTWGGFAGSQADLLRDLSKSISILCWIAEVSDDFTDAEDSFTEPLEEPFRYEEASSLSRSRSTI